MVWAHPTQASAPPRGPRVLCIGRPGPVFGGVAVVTASPDSLDTALPGRAGVILLAERLTPPQRRALWRFVRRGGWLLLGADGDAETLARVVRPQAAAQAGRGRRSGRDLILAVNRSGSMAGPRIEAVRHLIDVLARGLGRRDRLAVVAFEATARTLCRLADAAARTACLRHGVAKMTAAGGTSLFAALEAAYAIRAPASRRPHVILMTDDMSSRRGILAMVHAAHTRGVATSTAGIGAQADAGFLQEIAQEGAGRAERMDDVTPRALGRLAARLLSEPPQYRPRRDAHPVPGAPCAAGRRYGRGRLVFQSRSPGPLGARWLTTLIWPADLPPGRPPR